MRTSIRTELRENLNAPFIRPVVDYLTQEVNRWGPEVGWLRFEEVLNCG